MGGLDAFYWCQIFAQCSVVVVKTQDCLVCIEATTSSQRNNLIKLTHYDETKKRAHDSQVVKAQIKMHECSGWYEPLLVPHTTLLEISRRGPYDYIHDENVLYVFLGKTIKKSSSPEICSQSPLVLVCNIRDIDLTNVVKIMILG